jgi:hypothetical protein
MRNFSLLIIAVALALGANRSSAQRTYRRADIDSAGRLRIVLSNKHVIWPPKDSAQVAFEQVALSADGRIVGWLALYPNCCTSYPIPLKLVLRRMDGSRTVISNALPIWQWAFAAGEQNVVIRQAPVHGAAPVYYELREIRTGRLIAAVQADSATALPAWARAAQPKSARAPPLPGPPESTRERPPPTRGNLPIRRSNAREDDSARERGQVAALLKAAAGRL